MTNYEYIMSRLNPAKLSALILTAFPAVKRDGFANDIYCAFLTWLRRTRENAVGLHNGNTYSEGDEQIPDPRYWMMIHDEKKGWIFYGSERIGMQMFLDAEYNAEDWGE